MQLRLAVSLLICSECSARMLRVHFVDGFMRMVKVIFLAPPGAGKGTQSSKLAEATGSKHISTGDVLREAVKQGTAAGVRAKEYMDVGKLAPDEVVLQIVRDSLQSGKGGWIFDGFPRNEKQAISLDEILAELGQENYCTIYLEVPEGILIERIAERYKEFGRKDDHPDAVPTRLQEYRKQTAPLIEFYTQREALQAIDGNRPVDVIFDEIQTLTKSYAY